MESTTPSHRGGTKCGAVAVTMGGSPVRWLGVGGSNRVAWPRGALFQSPSGQSGHMMSPTRCQSSHPSLQLGTRREWSELQRASSCEC